MKINYANSEKHYGVIYCLINKLNNKMYVGQTVNLKERFDKYKRLNCKNQTKLYNALVKHGLDNFVILILDTASDRDELNQLEILYISIHNSIKYGYNLKSGGSSGGKHSDETKETIKKKLAETRSTRVFRKGANHPCFGRKLSTEHRRKIGLAGTGRVVSNETRKKLSESKKGDKHPYFGKQSEEMSFFGAKHSQESKEKISFSKNHLKKRIRCLQDGLEYESIKAACRQYKISPARVSGQLMKKKGFESTGGKVFEYVDKPADPQ